MKRGNKSDRARETTLAVRANDGIDRALLAGEIQYDTIVHDFLLLFCFNPLPPLTILSRDSTILLARE